MKRLIIIMLLGLIGLIPMSFGQKKMSSAEKQLQGKWKATKAIYDGEPYKMEGAFVFRLADDGH